MIEWTEFTSQAIQGFPMGDPATRAFPVYLPPGFSKSPPKPYPTVYFLAGFSGKGAAYLADDSAFGVPLQNRLDAAIQSGKLPAFIGVFPDCTSKLGHSQYVNSPAFGNYQTYLCDELTTFIDGKYPTARDAGSRILAGHSSGGFGALITAMQRPDSFHWIIASAADSFYEVSLLPNIQKVLITLQKSGGIGAFVESILARPTVRNISAGEFDTILTLAMAPCYAPNLDNAPIYGDLFFDLETGAVREKIWEKYLAWDPVRMVDAYASALKTIRFILLECGMQDEHALQWGHRQIAAKLSTHGISYQSNEYPGGHGGHHWRFESRLQTIFAKMG